MIGAIFWTGLLGVVVVVLGAWQWCRAQTAIEDAARAKANLDKWTLSYKREISQMETEHNRTSDRLELLLKYAHVKKINETIDAGRARK